MRIHDAANEIQSATELFMNAVTAQAVVSRSLPYVLSYAPIANMNPFQRLLYSQSIKHSFAIVPTLKFDNLGKFYWRDRSVIHLHWLGSVLKEARSEQDASARIKKFEETLLYWKAAGHRLVWTMHNTLPHSCQYQELEILLRKKLLEQVDAVHILSENSVDAASQYYHVPEEKCFFIPHPSYEGWYANVTNRVTARLDLGVKPGEYVFLQFGSIQRYKGTSELILAFEALEKAVDRPICLVIAGKPTDKEYLSELRSLALGRNNSSIRLILSAMEEREIQTLFYAADVVVAPYVQTLNSGVALLAATFNKGLVAPKVSGLLQTYVDDPYLLYSGKPNDTLLDAMKRSMDYSINVGVFKKILKIHKPKVISDRFFSAISERFF